MHRVLALSFLGVLKGIAEWGGFMGVLTVMGEGYEGFLMLGYQKSSPPIPRTHHSQRPMNFLSLALVE